jgi:cysteine-rich repeat protein
VCTTTEDCPPELFCPAFAGDLQAHCRSPRIPGCANGVVDEGEACDDANFLPHDGCSPDCLDE